MYLSARAERNFYNAPGYMGEKVLGTEKLDERKTHRNTVFPFLPPQHHKASITESSTE
jgi:hypothetical protein